VTRKIRTMGVAAASVFCSLALAAPALADVINGDAGNNTLTGTSGADYLYGKGGNDKLNPKAGNDYAYGGLGDDVLTDFWRPDGSTPVQRDWYYGGGGADRIYASARDQVYGGAGPDKVVLAYAGAGTLVDCGRGYDRLISNQPLHGVTVMDCERVRVVSAG
jgi:Ca2+-binding RTX toxin-like protein